MKKRMIAFMFICVYVFSFTTALSENRQIQFSFSKGKEKNTLEWGSSKEEVDSSGLDYFSGSVTVQSHRE